MVISRGRLVRHVFFPLVFVWVLCGVGWIIRALSLFLVFEAEEMHVIDEGCVSLFAAMS